MISTALVPLDGSEAAEQVIPNARALLPDGGEVIVFSVVPEVEPILTSDSLLAQFHSASRPAQEASEHSAVDATRTALEHVISRVADLRLGWRAEVAQGDSAQGILQA